MTAARSTWAPLRTGAFRTLWIAALVSDVGEWMQTVGAQWLLVHGPHAAILESSPPTSRWCPTWSPRPQVPAASALGSISINLARGVAVLSDPPPQTDHYLATDVRD